MSLVTQSPNENEIELKATQLIEMSDRVVITSDDEVQKASDLVKFIKTLYKKAEDERTSLVKPFNDGVKAINARFKTYTDPLAQAETKVKKEILSYEQEKARLRREEAERVAKEEAEKALALAAQQEQAGNIKEAEATFMHAAEVELSPVVQSVVAPIRGDYGSTTSIRKTWTYRVTSMVALSSHNQGELVLANDKAIKDLIKNGIRQINGVEIYQEESVAVR